MESTMKCVECGKDKVCLDYEKAEAICVGCGRLVSTIQFEKAVQEISRAYKRLKTKAGTPYTSQDFVDLVKNIVDCGHPTVF